MLYHNNCQLPRWPPPFTQDQTHDAFPQYTFGWPSALMSIARTTPIVVPQQPLGWLNPSTIGPTIVTMPQMIGGWHVVPPIPQISNLPSCAYKTLAYISFNNQEI